MNPEIENPGDRMAQVTIRQCHGAGQGKGYRACVPMQNTRTWAAQCGDPWPIHEQMVNSRYLPIKLRDASDGSQLRILSAGCRPMADGSSPANG
jgi:hypothetical protein